MYKFTVAVAATLFAGSALAGCVDGPRRCANDSAASNCNDNPSACMDHPKSATGPGVLQRLIERLREAQPKLAPSDSADHPAR